MKSENRFKKFEITGFQLHQLITDFLYFNSNIVSQLLRETDIRPHFNDTGEINKIVEKFLNDKIARKQI